MSRSVIRGVLCCLLALASCGAANAETLIDWPLPTDPPIPPTPWRSLWDQPVITYAFKTSWDGIGWTDEQKGCTRAAIGAIDAVLPNNTFAETGDFTVRWGGADFFKDWRSKDANGNPSGSYAAPGWDLTRPLAVAYKHNNGPWDANKFPNNEIYVNNGYPWHMDPNSPPPPGKYDLYTVMMHEVIHMLACDTHAVHPEEVMYETVEIGTRKGLQDSDLAILMNANYTVPEPCTAALLGLSLTILLRRRRK